VRSAIITLAAGVCVAVLMPEMPAYRFIASVPALPHVLLFLVAVVVGVLATHRAWLAAGCAYLLGVAAWVVAWLRPSPPWAPSDNWFFEVWVQFLLANVLLPTLVFGAAAAIAHFIAGTAARNASRPMV